MTDQSPALGSMKSLEPGLVTRELQQALRRTIFSSGMQVSPRQVNQFGEQFANAFFQFWHNRIAEEVNAFGRKLAINGLGPHSVLAMTESLRMISWTSSFQDQELPFVTGDFCNSLLESYMAGREAVLLEVQERTHRAYLSTLEQKQDEDR